MPFRKPSAHQLLTAALALAAVVLISVTEARRSVGEPYELSEAAVTAASTTPGAFDYERARSEFSGMVADSDPRTALAELRKRVETDVELLRTCHPIAHEIGHVAYGKYRDFAKALSFSDSICNSGYMHGVIESRFGESSDVAAELKTACSGYKEGTFDAWECHHGVGHGIMFSLKNDLPRSVALCETYKARSSRSACLNGVYMENFTTDQKTHLSEYLREDDPMYPCSGQKSANKPDCYTYAPTYYLSLHPRGYERALAWCKGAELLHVHSCVSGVGTQAMKENLDDPKYVERMCMTAGVYYPSCINGMASLYVYHYGALEPAYAMCDSLRSENAPICRGSVDASAPMFE